MSMMFCGDPSSSAVLLPYEQLLNKLSDTKGIDNTGRFVVDYRYVIDAGDETSATTNTINVEHPHKV